MVERAVRLLDERISFDDLVPTLQDLMRRYPYERQKRYENLNQKIKNIQNLVARLNKFRLVSFSSMPFLNYRAFEATIVLKSYRDRLIDMFDASILFQRLCVEAEDREMLRCGNALCLKPISIKGSHCKSISEHHTCTSGQSTKLPN